MSHQQFTHNVSSSPVPFISSNQQSLAELRQWFAAHRFPAQVLDRLIASDIGVQDVFDLAYLNDEELQRAGMSPLQLKRFAILQHTMHSVHNPPTISELAQNLDDIRKGFTCGQIIRSEADYMAKGVTADLARLSGTDPNGLFAVFAETLGPIADVSEEPITLPDVVPQVVSFIPGPVTVKLSCPGEEDRFIQTDSSGTIDVRDFPSRCTLQPMTQTFPPIVVGTPLQLMLPLKAERVVDLPATSVQSMFQSDDKPLANCKATGFFVTADNGTTVQISTTTDNHGALNIVLPPGRISDLLAESDDGTVAIAAQSVEVPARDLDEPPQPLQRIYSQKSSQIPFLNYCRGNRVAFLGDVSGSMCKDCNGRDTRIQVLRRTLSNAVDEVLQPDSTKTVSLCAWNDQTNWFQSKRWLNAADKDDAKAWVEQLEEDGQTLLEPAILQAVQLEKVSDIVTLCDGEFDEFDFDAIVRSYPEIRFHFVAIGDAADTEKMEKMASKGKRGFFQHEKSVPAA